uniref:DAP3 binding cell death enhancer 1 n=1 Tax=Latimeria chalumnae TaxID=7897 RepID=M3XHD5_LATCH
MPVSNKESSNRKHLLVLHRRRVTNVTNPPAPLRLTPAQCVEEDVQNPSPPLCSGRVAYDSSRSCKCRSSHSGQNGNGQKKEKNSLSYSSVLPRYTVLDAVGWGAAAVIFLQLARRIHVHFSSQNERRDGQAEWNIYLNRITASVLENQETATSRSILPGSLRVQCLNNSRVQNSNSKSSHSSTPDTSSYPSPEPSSFSSSSEEATTAEPEEFLFAGDVNYTEQSAGGEGEQAKADSQKEDLNKSLEEAASNLQVVTESSVQAVLNILGLQNVHASEYEMAFSYFMMAAKQGYSKAQYNVGVCFERGSGVPKDLWKAAWYYRLAAAQGHSMAQYRYAKYLLHHKTGSDITDAQEAIALLEQAAGVGLKEAQAYLGVLYMKAPHQDEQKAVTYLKMAAESGDSQSQYHLGTCYQNGIGVQQSIGRALKLFQQAAASGHPACQGILGTLYQERQKGKYCSYYIE